MLNKLVPVVGNVCESNFALEGDTADLIVNQVDVIVNSAANTTFDERYLSGPSDFLLHYFIPSLFN